MTRPLRLLRATLVPVIGFLLAACAGQPAVDTTGAISSTPAPGLYRMDASGAGPIRAGQTFGQNALMPLFPGRRMQSVRIADDGRTFFALAIFENGLQAIAVEPTADNARIAAVHGVGPDVAGPNGERIGMTFAEVGMDANRCRAGKGLWRGMPICTARGAPNVTLVFDPGPENTGANGALPVRSVIGRAQLQRIVWKPGS